MESIEQDSGTIRLEPLGPRTSWSFSPLDQIESGHAAGTKPEAASDPGLTSHDPKTSQHGLLMPHKGAAGLRLLHNKEQTWRFE